MLGNAFTDFITDQYQRNIQPVYNSGGRYIGYYSTDSDLCRGVINVFVEDKANAGPAESWQVKNLLGVLVPINKFCVSHGIKPPWLGSDDAQQIQQTLKPLNLPSFLNPPQLIDPVTGIPAKVSFNPMWILAGAGVIGVFIALSRSRA